MTESLPPGRTSPACLIGRRNSPYDCKFSDNSALPGADMQVTGQLGAAHPPYGTVTMNVELTIALVVVSVATTV